jgi:hypothetical protein
MSDEGGDWHLRTDKAKEQCAVVSDLDSVGDDIT